jgi:hypothetical protein
LKSKIFTGVLTLLIFFFTSTTFAAIPQISQNKYIKMYGLSAENNLFVYTSEQLNQRGTANPFKNYNATIYASDQIYVYRMTDIWSLISYPTSNGRRVGYVRTSDLTSNNFSQNQKICRAYIGNVYARPNGTRYQGSSISQNDPVWIVARQGNYIQLVYPAGNLYKMAWITSDDYSRYIDGGNVQNSNNNAAVSVNWNVPYYSQKDSRWAGVMIGTRNINDRGCLLTALAMKYSFHTNTNTTPDIMRNKLSFGGENGNDLYWSSVKNLGYTYSQDYSTAINNSILAVIYQELKNGKPVIIGGKGYEGQHWVVVTGYRGNSAASFNPADFIINDPSHSDRKTLNQFIAGHATIRRIIY